MICVMKKRKWLEVSLIVILGISLLTGCGQRSKKSEVGSGEVEDENITVSHEKLLKETTGVQKKQGKIETKELSQNVTPELSRKEKKQIEERILKIVNRIEKFPFFNLEGIKSIEDTKGKDVPDEEEIKRLIRELVSIGKAGVPTFIKIIKDKKRDEEIRMFFISLIADDKIKDDRTDEFLIGIINDKKESIAIRNEVVSILNEKIGKRFAPIEISSKEQEKVKKEVLKWLRKIERKCKLCLEYDERDARLAAGWITAGEIDNIEKIGKPAIPTLLEVFCHKNRNWMLRAFIGGPLCNYLYSLREKGEEDNRIFEPVIRVLEDRSEHRSVRHEAVIIIGELGDKRAVELLIKLYKTEEDGLIRIGIVSALRGLKDERAMNLFIEIMNNPKEEIQVRSGSIFGLAIIAEHPKFPLLI
ncbi:MAG: HEAT repeat domain-containing protein [bacterium]